MLKTIYHATIEAMRVLDTIPQDVFKPFDRSITDAFDKLDDALAELKLVMRNTDGEIIPVLEDNERISPTILDALSEIKSKG